MDALSFYTEPFLTYDLDIAILIDSKGKIFDKPKIYAYLKNLGYMHKGEYVVIEGVPVQFIVPKLGGLTEEAVRNSKAVKYKSVDTKVIDWEYLVAIILETNRPKDRVKLLSLHDQIEKLINKKNLEIILKKYKLLGKWRDYEKQKT